MWYESFDRLSVFISVDKIVTYPDFKIKITPIIVLECNNSVQKPNDATLNIYGAFTIIEISLVLSVSWRGQRASRRPWWRLEDKYCRKYEKLGMDKWFVAGMMWLLSDDDVKACLDLEHDFVWLKSSFVFYLLSLHAWYEYTVGYFCGG